MVSSGPFLFIKYILLSCETEFLTFLREKTSADGSVKNEEKFYNTGCSIKYLGKGERLWKYQKLLSNRLAGSGLV